VVMSLRRSGTSLSAVKVLQTAGDIEVVDQADDGRQSSWAGGSCRMWCFVDIRMSPLEGLAATMAISPDPDLVGMRILILTTVDEDTDVVQAPRARAGEFPREGRRHRGVAAAAPGRGRFAGAADAGRHPGR
jgi:DNA-binding NarL/FixJ family response regulator